MKSGIVLSGCGVMDGSEIHEAVLTLLALEQAGSETAFYAPDITQLHVVNHSTGDVEPGDQRNVLLESARIARGAIQPLDSINVRDIDALVFPGGFGAAKNLCTFALDGPACRVDPSVERIILEMVDAGKPVGALCIAPALIARVLGDRGIKARLTIGNDHETAQALETMGAIHVNCPVHEAVVDKTCRIVTSPAYMLARGIQEVADSAQAMVRGLMGLVE